MIGCSLPDSVDSFQSRHQEIGITFAKRFVLVRLEFIQVILDRALGISIKLSYHDARILGIITS